METNLKKQRQAFVRDYESGQWSMTELCQRYRVSRPTGYKWIDRFEEEGEEGLEERSRAPMRCPHHTPASVERRILVLRAEYAGAPRSCSRYSSEGTQRCPGRLGVR
jgi:transposase-like protein